MKTQKEKERRKDIARGVMFLVVSSMLVAGVLAVYSPVHASGPSVVGAAGAWNGGNLPIGMTVGNSLHFNTGDVVVVEAMAQSSIASPGAGLSISVTSVTDTTAASDITFTLASSGLATCDQSGASGCEVYSLVSFYIGTFVGAAGTDTISVTFAQSGATNAQLNMMVEDLTGVTATVIGAGSGSCSSFAICPTGKIGTYTNTANTIVIGGILIDQSVCANPGTTNIIPGAGYVVACPINATATGAAEYAVGLSAPSPTTVTFTQASNTSSWDGASIMLGNAAGGTTNIQCTPLCTPSNGGSYVSNSTSMFFGGATGTMFYAIQQAPVTILTVQNITVEVSQVRISTPAGKIGYALYEPSSPLAPAGAGNQWTLQKSSSWPITNNTNSFFLHANPGWQVCASCYYMVAILANSTHSNSHLVVASGVKFFETNTPFSEYYYGGGSPTFPTTFYASNLQTPRLFLYVEGVFTLLTTTVTSTLTGTSFTTQVITVTSTTLDANLSIQTTTGYTLALLIILVPALALGGVIAFTTKSFPGFAVGFITGAAIGTGLGVQYSLVTVQFEALAAIAMVFMAVMAFITSRGSGGV